MITYQQVEEWWAERENKNKVVIAAGFVVVFLVGFGTGRYERAVRRDAYKVQSNYTTQNAKKPEVLGAQTGAGQGRGGATSTLTSANCVVKGNISAAGKKIFHVLGGAFYARVKPEQCFNTEQE